MSPILHFPRPRSFLHLISLRTATEFITFTLAINKATGLYGILALFTGYHLNILQLSHYIYSLILLALVAYLSSAVRQRDADGVLKVLLLAWIYIIDTVISSAYTALFGLGWFVLLAQHLNDPLPVPGNAAKVPGGSMMNDTAGFTNPEHSVSHVDVVATPAPDTIATQQATTYAYSGTMGAAVLAQGSLMSITVLGLLWIIRFYFCIIVLSFARSQLRQQIARTSTDSSSGYSTAADPTMAEDPFQPGRAEGEGWRGKLGRFMLRFPSQRYWLGKDESEEEWARQTSSRLESARGLRIKVPKDGVGERERRARSGTGPPVPPSVKSSAPQ